MTLSMYLNMFTMMIVSAVNALEKSIFRRIIFII